VYSTLQGGSGLHESCYRAGMHNPGAGSGAEHVIFSSQSRLKSTKNLS